MTSRIASAPARGGVRLLLLSLVFLAAGAFAAAGTEHEQTLERIDVLLESEAWRLALGLIESAQSERGDAGTDWEELERRRVLVYRNLPDAAALADRLARLPPSASHEIRRWMLTQTFEAALSARDFARARTALEQLLAGTKDADDARRWRERLAQTYLQEGRVEEALAAFAPLAAEEDARALHAELLLRAGREGEAFERVAGLKSPEARLWRLTAAMRLGLYAPADVSSELMLVVRELKDRPDLQRLAWLVRADAARRAGQLAARVNSLERVFRINAPPAAGLYAATPDDLWSAYLALGRHVAWNEPLSADKAALERAEAYLERDAYTARALFAWLAFSAEEEQIRTAAHERLVTSLSARGLQAVTHALYTESGRFARDEIPAAVRHALMTDALSRRDVRAAAKHARDLATPPSGKPVDDWTLRRARVLLYGGEPDRAVRLLRDLVAAPEFGADFAPRFLQVVFDLQSLGLDREALILLESVYARVDDARMHRELLYWQAESTAALNRFTDAAELYLRSARFGDDDGRDPWGHSARYRAAEMLVKAGLTKDAEALYRKLLKETADPDRRFLIEQNIERLWLAAPAPTPTTP